MSTATTQTFTPGDKVIYVFQHSRNYRKADGGKIVANEYYPQVATFKGYTEFGRCHIEFDSKHGIVKKCCPPDRIKRA
jgi:hypothetical protein